MIPGMFLAVCTCVSGSGIFSVCSLFSRVGTQPAEVCTSTNTGLAFSAL